MNRFKTISTLAFILFFALNLLAQDKPISPSQISNALYFDIYGPLKDLPATPKELRSEKNDKVKNPKLKFRSYPFKETALPKGADAVWQKGFGAKTKSANTQLLFEGQISGYNPPDCNGDVGLNHFFQTINTSYSIYDKNGNTLVDQTDLNTLFEGLPGADVNDGDPIVLYDDQSDRWLMAEFSGAASDPDYMLIAVSTTGDPTGTWYRWSFLTNGFPDYMKLGIWQDGYYMATNTAGGSDIYVFERSAMLAGSSNPKMVSFQNPWRPVTIDGFHTLQPLDNDGTFAPANTPGIFVTMTDDAIAGGADELWVYELDVNWSNTVSSTFNRIQRIAVSPFDSDFGETWDNIKQPGTAQKVDAIPTVLMYRAQYRNFGSEEKIVICHTVDVDNTDHAGIRWYELSRSGGASWSVRQQSTYAPDENSRWMGSIAINKYNEIALGFSISSSTVFPGIRYVGQSFSENKKASGILDIAEVNVHTGQFPQSWGERWGDYSSMSVDPSDDKSFWFTTQYIPGFTEWEHGTKILNFQFDSPVPVELASFSAASIEDGKIQLNWMTATETNNSGFDIERSTVNSNWQKIGFIEGKGNSTDKQNYSFTDIYPEGGSSFSYRLKQIDYDGSFEYSDQIEVVTVPVRPEILQNYPNPFNPETNIRYRLASPNHVTLKLFNSVGEEVAILVNEFKEIGQYEYKFDGTEFASGVYFLKIQVEDFIQTKKMILLK